jgi:tellurite resistance protein
MNIYEWMGLIIWTVGGAATATLLSQLYYGRKNHVLLKRLGRTDETANQRASRKVSILKAIAYKDESFSVEEKIFLYDYILQSPDLAADQKVTLTMELNDQPTSIFAIFLDHIKTSVSFEDLFSSNEDAAGFISTMLGLANIDGECDQKEFGYIVKICTDCNIPEQLIPSKDNCLEAVSTNDNRQVPLILTVHNKGKNTTIPDK